MVAEMAPASHWPDKKSVIPVLSSAKKVVCSTAHIQATVESQQIPKQKFHLLSYKLLLQPQQTPKANPRLCLPHLSHPLSKPSLNLLPSLQYN